MTAMTMLPSPRNSLLGLLLCLCMTVTQGTVVPPLKREKSHLCPDPTTPPLTVFIGLKTTTATRSYSARTEEIMNSWGASATGNLALITDGINPKHNIGLKQEHPSLPIIEMLGSEKFGEYRHGAAHRRVGYASQRVKVRSLIKWFHDSVRNDSGIEWLCYIDDDMYVNMNILNNELSRMLAIPPPTCSRLDRCVVADVGPITLNGKVKVHYSNAVWCMTMPTLSAVYQLLQEKTDVMLGWDGDVGSDDVGFALMLQKNLNITFTNSLTMFSINNVLAVDPPGRENNPVGTYKIRKVNLRDNSTEYRYLREHKAPSDVLARLGVLNLPHVNYTELATRPGPHKLAFSANPRLLVNMKWWNAYVHPQPTCRQPLNLTLRLDNSDSYILKYER